MLSSIWYALIISMGFLFFRLVFYYFYWIVNISFGLQLFRLVLSIFEEFLLFQHCCYHFHWMFSISVGLVLCRVDFFFVGLLLFHLDFDYFILSSYNLYGLYYAFSVVIVSAGFSLFLWDSYYSSWTLVIFWWIVINSFGL